MVCGWSLLSLSRHLLPTLHPRVLDVYMLSSDGTGPYLCVSILYIPSPACWGDLTSHGYPGLVWGPCSVVLSHFTPELQWEPELSQL